MNCLWFLSGLPDASGKSVLRKLGFGYMLSPMMAYTSRIIMQAIPARLIYAVALTCGKAYTDELMSIDMRTSSQVMEFGVELRKATYHRGASAIRIR